MCWTWSLKKIPLFFLLLVALPCTKSAKRRCFVCDGSDRVYPYCGSRVLLPNTNVANVSCSGLCETRIIVRSGAAAYYRTCNPNCTRGYFPSYGVSRKHECCSGDYCNGPVRHVPVTCYSCSSKSSYCPESGMKTGDVYVNTCRGYCKKTVETITYLGKRDKTVTRSCAPTCEDTKQKTYATDGQALTSCCETNYCNSAKMLATGPAIVGLLIVAFFAWLDDGH